MTVSEIQETDVPFKLGQRVRHKKPIIGSAGFGEWRDDWIGTEAQIVGMAFDRNGKLNLHLSENWPKDGGYDGVSPEDIEAI